MQILSLIFIMLLVRISGHLRGATVLHLKGKCARCRWYLGTYNFLKYLFLDVNASGNNLREQG